MAGNKKDKEISHDRESDTVTDSRDDHQAAESSKKKPYWSDESESRRVRVSIWRHDQANGKVRYTTALVRSYYDEREKRWVNSSYFDTQDLDDVVHFANLAKKKLDELTENA
jgi:hypothetical protein